DYYCSSFVTSNTWVF
nr:immunoglobulin light chain junction region [Macaca mulatta]